MTVKSKDNLIEMTNSNERQSLYIGNVLKHERNIRGLKAEDVCSGICTVRVYSKMESGAFVGDIHLKRALFERLGIHPGKAGIYLCHDEYDEVSKRIEILDILRRTANSHITAQEKISSAQEKLLEYDRIYLKNLKKEDIFNRQFSLYMHGRLKEIDGDKKAALDYYVDAAACTIPAIKKYAENNECAEDKEYCKNKNYAKRNGYTQNGERAENKKYMEKVDIPSCLTLDEFFLLSNIARLLWECGDKIDKKMSISIYHQLLNYCEGAKVEIWNLVCMYPKVVCELLKVQPPEMLGNYDRRNMLKSCDKALDLLRHTSRLHFVLNLIENKRVLMKLLDEKLDSHWETFAVSYKYVQGELGYEKAGELLEWYPYYVGWNFYSVEGLIDERRKMLGMSMEELAEGVCTYETVSRIVNCKVKPTRTTLEKLLKKLGLEGIRESHVIVSESMEIHNVLHEIVNCQAMNDAVAEKMMYGRLKGELDTSIELNKTFVNYERAVLNLLYNENVDYMEMSEQFKKMLVFPIEDAGRYKYLTQTEDMIIGRYFDCMNRIKNYENLEVLQQICENYSKSEKIRCVMGYESDLLRYADYTANAGYLDKSDIYEYEGVELELDCERMHRLADFLYGISWNNGERGKVTDRDIKFCKCASEMAWYVGELKKIKFYDGWIEEHKDKVLK